MTNSRVPANVLSASIATVILATLLLVGCSSDSSTKTATTDKTTSTAAGTPAGSPSTETEGSSSSTVVPAAVPDGVNIVNYAFGPKSLSVKTGTTVTWKNYDQYDHQVASVSGDPGLAFDLGVQGPDKSVQHTFTAPGTYAYICNIHNYMKGTIVVTQ
jgi:plastocyanin